jgi:homoserine kinase type II
MSKVICPPGFFDHIDVQEILKQWDINLESLRPDIPICGSPERTNYRIVIEDISNRLFILEMFSLDRYSHKQHISEMLQQLIERDVQAISHYQKTTDGDYVLRIHDVCWQLIPFIPGISLKRPEHVKDTWRGEASAYFLIELWKKTASINIPFPLSQFSLKTYVLEMSKTMRKVHPNQFTQILPALNWLKEDFFHQYDTLPQRFCHGDFHPLNIIWSETGINAVIDWEFLGLKLENYDIANMIGCLGIEHPSALFDGFARSFLTTIAEHNLIKKRSMDYLVECIVCIRFAWLAEWFRKGDQEMIDLEISYINLLMQNNEFIKETWKECL